MQFLKSFVVPDTIAVRFACGNSARQKKDLAEAELTGEKTKTIKQYEECINKAREDTARLA